MGVVYRENNLFCCDNIKLLRSIPRDTIDLIYCDVLYGTGEDFGEFKDIRAEEAEVREFYTERIMLMRNILKDTGSIYIQVDTRINHWLRAIMDEIFGYDNFRNEIVWWKKTFSQNNERTFLRRHDNILFYTKSDDFCFNPQYVFNEKKLNRIKKGYFSCGKKKILIYDYEKFEEYKRKNDITGKILVDRTNDVATVKCHDVFDDIYIVNPNSHEFNGYPTQKPLALMERLIKASSKDGYLVADFFMGSGSFIVKAKELGRKYIGCDINNDAVELTQRRLDSIELHPI